MAHTLIFLMLLVWVSLGLYGTDAHKGCWALPFLMPVIVGYLVLAMLVWVASFGTRQLYLTLEDT